MPLPPTERLPPGKGAGDDGQFSLIGQVGRHARADDVGKVAGLAVAVAGEDRGGAHLRAAEPLAVVLVFQADANDAVLQCARGDDGFQVGHAIAQDDA